MSGSGTRSRSRSPIREDSQEPYEIDSCSEDNNIDEPPTPDCKQFHIDNYPSSWSYKDIKQFIKDRTNSSIISDAIKYVNWDKNGPTNTSTIEFFDSNACKQAYIQLKTRQREKCERRIIYINWTRRGSSQKSLRSKFSSKNTSNSNTARNSIRRNAIKPTTPQISPDTYGLSQEFLDELGIKLPILNKVFVANLDKQVTEAKLREVFSIAGQIVDVFIILNKDSTKQKMAKIEYDHPLEAVQAISMFNNHELYKRAMVVKIDTAPNLHSKPLPDGLGSIGPGLGPNGAPMRGMRYTAEIQPLKELVNAELHKIIALIKPAEQNSVSQLDVGMMGQTVNMQAMTPLNVNTMTAYNQTVLPVPNPFVNTQGVQNMQMIQGMLQQNTGNDFTGALAAMQAQSTAQNMGFAQRYGTGQRDLYTQSLLNMQQQSQISKTQTDSSGSKNKSQAILESDRSSYSENKNNTFDIPGRNSEEIEKNMMTTDMLIFNNLPSSVTLPALKRKMSEVGDIKFAEITDEGKAIVRFRNAQDAERCVKLFDRSKVDGHTIQVRFF